MSQKKGTGSFYGFKGRAFSLRVLVLAGLFPACLAAALLPRTSIAQTNNQCETPYLADIGESYYTLRWSCGGDLPIPLFRISELFSEDSQIFFTDQAELKLLLLEPGDYEYRVQSCDTSPGEYLLCGEPSSPFILTINPHRTSGPEYGIRGGLSGEYPLAFPPANDPPPPELSRPPH